MCEVSGQNGSDHGVILGTNNGGASWTEQTTPALSGFGLDIVCPSTTTCEAAGSGVLLGTTDGGAVWTSQSAPAGVYLLDVECSSTTTCEAGGNTGGQFGSAAVIGTTNGGTTWSAQTLPTGIGNYVSNIVCPSSSVCYAGAFENDGVTNGFPPTSSVLKTTNGA